MPVSVFAQDAQDQDASEAILEEVIVTGIRASLDNSAAIKREADTIVDAITAEDIGLFSDNNMGEALQRIPGVQLERSEGEGYRISIRGLGPRFVRTTLNGRTALSSPGGEGGSDARGFSFNIIPSEVISRASVHKSSQAMDVEGGIGGVVNLETTRPLDFAADEEKDFYVSGALRGTHNDFSGDNNYRGSIFFNQKVNDSFAIFLSGVVETADRWQDSTESQDFQIEKFKLAEGTVLNGSALEDDTTYELAIFDGVRNYRRDIERDRTTITGGFQWQPSDNWDVYFDWTRGETEEAREDYRSWLRVEDALDRLNDKNSPTVITDITVDFDDADEFSDGTVLAFDFLNFTEDKARQYVDIANLLIDSDTTNDVGGINAKWSNDDWTVAFDIGYAAQERVFLQRRMNSDLDFATEHDPARFPLEGSVPDHLAGEHGSFDITGGVPLVWIYDPYGNPFDVNSLDDLNFDQDRQSYIVEDNSELSFRLDTTKEVDWGVFDRVYAGYAYRDRDGYRTELRTEGNAGTKATGEYSDIKVAQYGSNMVRDFMGGEIGHPSFIPSFMTPDIRGWIAADPAGTFSKDPKDGLVRQDVEYDIGEKISAFYLQAGFSSDGRVPYRGNIGIRYALTDQTSTGFVGVQEGSDFYPLDPDNPTVTTKRDYDDWLPSFNIAFDVSEQTVLRFAASKTVTRPDPVDLRQGWDLDKDLGEDLVGKAGNPDLEAYRTDNFDFSWEWYPESGGAYAFGLFYKKLDGFISDGVDIVLLDLGEYDPDYAGEIYEYEITRPVNTDGGDIKGAEFAVHQPFDAFTDGFMRYFGMNLSLTWVDAELDAVREGTNRYVELRGTSEWSANIIGYFEKGPFSARLAYNWRDDYLHQEAVSAKDFDEWTEGGEVVDLNLDWRFNRNWRIRFSANNLTDTQRLRNFCTAGGCYFSDQRQDGRSYVLELRGQM